MASAKVRGVPRAVREIEKELARRGWTQGELARRLGTSSGVVCRWLTGERLPGLDLALRVESLLGVDPKHWLDAA
jgi:transcriptional regulator with XRE-family HTH domain